MHDFIGKSQTASCAFDPARARALHATLAQTSPVPEPGDALVPFGHQIYFWDAQPPEDLGRDGHPTIGESIPDLGLPRRMWAGGTLQFHTDLVTGTPATKRTTIKSILQKTGRTGPLAFVTLRHEIRQANTLCVIEDQDLVYRQDVDLVAPKPTAPAARSDETQCQAHRFSTTELFRYSALTMNGHRIHYDEEYARRVEGYDGLVTHGPLLAQYLMLMAEQHLGALKSFQFRATSPLMHTEPAEFCLSGAELWVRGPDGRECMQATAIPA